LSTPEIGNRVVVLGESRVGGGGGGGIVEYNRIKRDCLWVYALAKYLPRSLVQLLIYERKRIISLSISKNKRT
jgi:hypothetical protein